MDIRPPPGSRRGEWTMSTSVLDYPLTTRGAVPVTHHRAATVDRLNIIFREAGPANSPAVLLHGFSTSLHMFRNLIPLWRVGIT